MLPSRSVFNIEFWLLTVGLVFLWTLVLSTTPASAATPVQSVQRSQRQLRPNNEKRSPMQEGNCKTLCKQCGCMGFYCGEECICECNNGNSKIGTECVAGMRSEALQRRIPFQLLIQGPNRNRFLKKAIEYSQKTFGGNASAATDSKKRSSVLIYKPVASPTVLENRPKAAFKRSNNKKNMYNKRPKRSVGHLDWFNDFANTLVRPAPLGGKKRSNPAVDSDEIVAQAHYKRAAANKQEMDRSWFADSPSLLLRPAPFFKKQRNNADTVAAAGIDTTNSKDDDGSFELPIRGVGKLPKVLQDTLRNLHDTTIGGDAANELGLDTLRNHIKEGANVLQSQLTDGNLEIFPTNGVIRDNIQQTLSQFFTPNNENDRPSEMLQQTQQQITIPRMMPKKFTWFRPVRFLQRVQQAIN